MKIDVVGIRLVKEREIDYDKPIKKPIDTVNFVLEEMQDLDREMCMTLNLDANNCVLNAHIVSVGGLDSSIVDVKSVMKSALLSNACGIIMYHNHPSGNSTPSQEDFQITEKIKRACEIMDIQFLDHIIIGKENYYSIRGEYTKPYDTSKRKAEKITRVLTIQSSDLDVSKKVYADKDRCNYQEALPIYRRLFDDYNRMKETDYSSFFWGFSKLKTKDMDKAIERACHMIGKETNGEMQFWTKEEYMKFSKAMMKKDGVFQAFEILYWCGIRLGEMLALTPSDFDFEKKTVRINKSYQRLHGKDIITDPKTAKSNRVVQMPDFLADEMQDYISRFYTIEPDERIFILTKSFLHHEMDRGCKETGVKRIRIHDLRHSHVSLLIEMGFTAVDIANRVGHESVKITYRYAHMFPSKDEAIAKKLTDIRGGAFDEQKES